jgi:ribosomal RNA-processing protein 1
MAKKSLHNSNKAVKKPQRVVEEESSSYSDEEKSLDEEEFSDNSAGSEDVAEDEEFDQNLMSDDEEPASAPLSAAASSSRPDNTNLTFAQRLAHNEKRVRDNCIKKLKHWLQHRQAIESIDMFKIWKGLFYCYWMSDKQQIQMELATRISELLIALQPHRNQLFFNAGILTLNREWGGIDRLRLDKFMSLVRKFLHYQLLYAKQHQFDQKILQQTMNDLYNATLHNNTHTRGLFLHITDCLLVELEKLLADNNHNNNNKKNHKSHKNKSNKAATSDFTYTHLLIFLDPYFQILQQCKEQSMIDRTKEEIFESLLNKAQTNIQLQNEESKEASEEQHSLLGAIVEENAQALADKFFQLASDK